MVLHSQAEYAAGDHPLQTEPRGGDAGGPLHIPAPTQSLLHDLAGGPRGTLSPASSHLFLTTTLEMDLILPGLLVHLF